MVADQDNLEELNRFAELYQFHHLYFLTPVNGKQASILFSTRLKGISALVIPLSS